MSTMSRYSGPLQIQAWNFTEANESDILHLPLVTDVPLKWGSKTNTISSQVPFSWGEITLMPNKKF